MSDELRSVSISLASPEAIRGWSFGEVTLAETIDPKTRLPTKGGLNCEDIFGRESTESRGDRFGHIELAAPVVHFWCYSRLYSPIHRLLDLSLNTTRNIVEYRAHVVVDSGEIDIARGHVFSDSELEEARARFGDGFEVLSGAEAIRWFLDRLDLDQIRDQLRSELRELSEDADETERGIARLRRVGERQLRGRLSAIEPLCESGNRPEWMVLDVLPVLPTSLRPLVWLPDGNIAYDDVNDLYRRVINRNNRLRKLLELNAPEVIIRNEKRMLQQEVNALFDNEYCRKPVCGEREHPLRSLGARVRHPRGGLYHLVGGKRVDFSGRSVVVCDPSLRLHQCGLPKVMAWELYRPFVMRELISRGAVESESVEEACSPRVGELTIDALEASMRHRPVLLARPPIIERSRFLALEPVLVEDRSLHIHPMLADVLGVRFAGEQVAVHLPLSEQARAEALELMLASKNLRSPTDGELLVFPRRDVLLGCAWLTSSGERVGKTTTSTPRRFADRGEVLSAWQSKAVDLHEPITVRLTTARTVLTEPKSSFSPSVGEWFDSGAERTSASVSTTVGRVVFDSALPEGMPFYNGTLTDRRLEAVLDECQRRLGQRATAGLLERIARLGSEMLARWGLSLSLDDLRAPPDKNGILDEARTIVSRSWGHYQQGLITREEHTCAAADAWTKSIERSNRSMMDRHWGERRACPSPLAWMVESDISRLVELHQLVGTRMLYTRRDGSVDELPIESNLGEGLTTSEYFRCVSFARDVLFDREISRLDPSYLLRRLVRVTRDILVREHDCGSAAGCVKASVRTSSLCELRLARRIRGRVAMEDVADPTTGEVIVRRGEFITDDLARRIEAQGVGQVRVRSPMTCESARGVCQLCYGIAPLTGELAEIGTAVGLLAAQSFGAFGQRLRLRGPRREAILSPRVYELLEARQPRNRAVLATISGRVTRFETTVGGGRKTIFVQQTDREGTLVGDEFPFHVLPGDRPVLVFEGDDIEAGTPLTNGPIWVGDVLMTLGLETARDFLLRELYSHLRNFGMHERPGADIDERHLELIIGRMTGFVRVTEAGDSGLHVGSVVDRLRARSNNSSASATFEDLLLGAARIPLDSNGFLARVRLWNTVKELFAAALAGEVDELTSLDSCALVGRLAPVGTGLVDG